jgi:hypothetical protein
MAAGLGFKTFTTGEVLTAADTNGYLMQGINVFASTAARDAAITSPQEGQFAYTKDTNSLWYYTGSAWAASGATGDIEGVTAGVGITGGGTSGTVTITNDMATTITAAGDIVIGTGSGTYDNLPIGTTAQVLTADTTVSPYKVKWATPAGGGGKVLQVVMGTTATATTISSTTMTDSTLTATITPTLSTSKVLVLVSQEWYIYESGSPNAATGNFRLLRGSTTIQDNGSGMALGFETTGISAAEVAGTLSISYLDSPATTSATTYKTQGRNAGGVDFTFQRSANTSTMILLEIGA